LEIKKLLDKPRDLKPTNISFSINNITYNLFDLDSVRLSYRLYTNTLTKEDTKFLREFSKKFKVPFNNKEGLMTLLGRWTQRNLQLLDNDFVMHFITDETNLDDYFGDDSLFDSFYDVKSHYILNNSLPVKNKKFDAAELIMGDIYKSTFNRDNESIHQINTLKEEFFKEKLNKYLSKDDTKADIKLYIDGLTNPIYIRYVDTLDGFDTSINIRRTISEDGTELKSVRFNSAGQEIYTLPNNEYFRVITEDGKEIIQIKALTKSSIGNQPAV
jgi:hypothetical protein